MYLLCCSLQRHKRTHSCDWCAAVCSHLRGSLPHFRGLWSGRHQQVGAEAGTAFHSSRPHGMHCHAGHHPYRHFEGRPRRPGPHQGPKHRLQALLPIIAFGRTCFPLPCQACCQSHIQFNRSRQPSVLVILLAGIAAMATILTGISKGSQGLQDLIKGQNISFKPFCQ